MNDPKNLTAAATVAHHNAVNEREAQRLAAIARAKVQGSRRAGLNPSDIQRLVKALQNLEPWDLILRRESALIMPETLVNWKPALEKLAFEPPQPVIPPKRGG